MTKISVITVIKLTYIGLFCGLAHSSTPKVSEGVVFCRDFDVRHSANSLHHVMPWLLKGSKESTSLVGIYLKNLQNCIGQTPF